MAGGTTGSGRTATLNLMVGIFLKLLGFFVVLYSYTEVNPIKAHQAEQSLAQRFNVSVSLMRDQDEKQQNVTAPIQNSGRAYREISDKLKTQIDFLSTQTMADSDTLVLRVPAATALPLDGHEAGDAEFATELADVLSQQNADGYVYALHMTVNGADDKTLMRELGQFADKIVGQSYPASLVTIGFKQDNLPPILELRVKQVRK